jgi:hypothetical protein
MAVTAMRQGDGVYCGASLHRAGNVSA